MAFVLTMQLPLTIRAQERNRAAGNSPKTCQIFGQVFGTDAPAGSMLVKTPSGSIGTLLFDPTTSFTAVSFDAGSSADAGSSTPPTPLTPEAVNVGDWICARTGADVNAKPVATVLVARRKEIQIQQREALTRLLRDAAFGTVIELNADRRSMVLESHVAGKTKRVAVNTSEKTSFHRYVWEGSELSAIAPATGTQVRLGEKVYVDGSSSGGTNSLNARSVICGDLQAVAGTIGAIDALDETVRLNELVTNEAITVHVKPGGLRLISPAPESLQTIDFGDLREGDSVIVLKRPDESSGKMMDGVALVVNFGEPTPQGADRQVIWKLMSVRLGLP